MYERAFPICVETRGSAIPIDKDWATMTNFSELPSYYRTHGNKLYVVVCAIVGG